MTASYNTFTPPLYARLPPCQSMTLPCKPWFAECFPRQAQHGLVLASVNGSLVITCGNTGRVKLRAVTMSQVARYILYPRQVTSISPLPVSNALDSNARREDHTVKTYAALTLAAHVIAPWTTSQAPLPDLSVTPLSAAVPVKTAHVVFAAAETNFPALLRQPTSLPAAWDSTRT